MLGSTSNPTLTVSFPNIQSISKTCIPLFLHLAYHGNLSPWIIWQDSILPSMETTMFLWLSTNSLRHIYNPCTWDERFPYVQHTYNRDLHNLTICQTFKVGLGFQPLFPIDLTIPLVVIQETSNDVQSNVNKDNIFIECIPQLCQKFHEILDGENFKYKQRHDQYCVPHNVNVAEHFWLHL